MLFIWCMLANTNAQFFRSGLIGGVAVSQIDGDNLVGYNKLGPIGGAFVEYDFTDRITGYFELKYIQKGKVKSVDVTLENPEYFKIALDYVQLPVFLRYKLGYGFDFELGLGFAYLFNARFYDEYGQLPKDDFSYAFHSFELSSLLGLRYDINSKYFVTARWSMSFLPVANVLSGDIGTIQGASPWEKAGNQYNRSLEFTFGYRFGNAM